MEKLSFVRICVCICEAGEWLVMSPFGLSWPMLPFTFCGMGDLRGCEAPGPLSGDMPSIGAKPGGAPRARAPCD